jgi:hypothetical protein
LGLDGGESLFSRNEEKAVVPAVTSTVKVVGDSTAAALEKAEKITDGVVLPVIKGTINVGSKITDSLMVPVEKIADLVVAPTLLKFGMAPGVLKPIYDPIGYTGKAVAGVSQAGDHALQGIQTISLGVGHLDGRMFLRGLGQTTGAGIELGLNPALMETVNYATPIPWFSFESGMEKPEITVITPEHQTSSEMVLFINGMATTREEALAEASALAEHLGRPVGLLYNLHTTELSDAAQALVTVRTCSGLFLRLRVTVLYANSFTTWLIPPVKSPWSAIHREALSLMRLCAKPFAVTLQWKVGYGGLV